MTFDDGRFEFRLDEPTRETLARVARVHRSKGTSALVRWLVHLAAAASSTDMWRGKTDLKEERRFCPACRRPVVILVHLWKPAVYFVACHCGYQASHESLRRAKATLVTAKEKP